MDLHLHLNNSMVADMGLCPLQKEQLLTLTNPLKAEPYTDDDLCPHCNSFVALHLSISVTSLLCLPPPNFTDVAPNTRKQRDCPHSKRKDRCKLCGGIGICIHGRMKAECVSCKGAGICEHNRRRVTCKECGGKSICQHHKRRTECRDCGGGSVCIHGFRKYTCRDCKGSSICQHDRNRYHCPECLGAKCCPHGKAKSGCRACKRERAKNESVLKDTVAGAAAVSSSTSMTSSVISTALNASHDSSGLQGYHIGLPSSFHENPLNEINQLSRVDYGGYNLF